MLVHHALHALRGLLVALALAGSLMLLHEAGAELSGPRSPIADLAPVGFAR
jgi:hypothetical protein